MVILHIASIYNTSVSGMDVAVPLHVNAQSEYAEVGFVNVTEENIPAIKNQFPYQDRFVISDLPQPFCKPDLIVFHEVYKPVYLRLYKQAKSLGIPYIIFPQGCLTKTAQKKKKIKKTVANILLFNAFIRGAAALQFLSEWERDHSSFGMRKIVGGHGMHVPNEKRCVPHSQRIRFLYIGRTEVYIKGLDLMLNAIYSIADKLRELQAKFYICGPDFEGGHAKICDLITTLSLNDLVELKEAVIGEEKEEKLLNADIFIQTSRTDGFPLGVLEAMSYGLPCLVTEGTSYGSVISQYDTGWVAQTDVRSIAETILKAIDERKLWKTKSENAAKLVEEKYSWSKAAYNIVREYKQVLN